MFNWTCPYCNKPQTVTRNCDDDKVILSRTDVSDFGKLGLFILHIVCANEDCKKITLKISLAKVNTDRNGNEKLSFEDFIEKWDLLPDSDAKPFPDYIPSALIQDYQEACKIKNLSPKASATLSRRCVQGMIRDFCKISKNRLIDEVNELKKLSVSDSLPKGVTHDSVEAIDHVRKIGNIGAHFEKDINVILDVDPFEAQALIDLIEMLFDEWYIAANVRRLKLEKIKSISEQKELLKKPEVDAA